MIKFTKERFEISKSSIKITLALGCGYNPDYTVEHNLKPIIGTPYIKFENKWYPIRDNKFSYYEDLVEYLKKDNFSEEIFLEKIMRLIYPDKA